MELLPLFKGLADPVRLRIVHLLTQRAQLCVCHLTDALALPQSTISRHLNTLKHAGLVQSERKGQWVHYHLCHNHPAINTLSTLVRRHAADDPLLQQDLQQLDNTVEC